ncbi:MAG TPA: polyprenyl synthetase family protein [Chloroflexota bacterium]|nr:polyprenyl synthetase family protein [Chloroflexota bacterium]
MVGSLPTAILDRYGAAVEAELHRWLDRREPVGHHYDLMAYHMGWVDQNFELSDEVGGKRFRPLLCLLSCEAVGGDRDKALPIAAAIELLHNFSLIHDDIEDRDESRRHRPALWARFGEPLAINAGDAMLALAGLAALSAGDVPEICRGFQETALALTEGQYLDMCFEREVTVSLEEYRRMIGLKTSALITFSCRSGALIGGGDQEQVDALETFGRHFGLAFQIYDDILGIWAASGETGKIQAKDIVNRKKSLPVVLGLERSRGAERDLLISFYSRHSETEPEEIVRILDGLNIRADIDARLESHLRQALRALQQTQLYEPFRSELEALARALLGAGPA